MSRAASNYHCFLFILILSIITIQLFYKTSEDSDTYAHNDLQIAHNVWGKVNDFKFTRI